MDIKLSKANETRLEKAYEKLTALMPGGVMGAVATSASSFMLSVFLSVFFEALPMILTAVAPKILAKPKLVAVLRKTYEVIGKLLKPMDE